MRRLLKILAVLVVVLIVAIGAFIAFLPTERIATLAVEQVKAATGRDLTLAEGVSPSFYPVLGIETGAVTLSNADWAEASPHSRTNGIRLASKRCMDTSWRSPQTRIESVRRAHARMHWRELTDPRCPV